MIEFTRKGRKIEYYLKDESPHPSVPWRELEEDGWCSSDDGYVIFGRVKHITEIRGKGFRVRKRVRFDYGVRYTHGTSQYVFLEALANKSGRYSTKDRIDSAITGEPGLIDVFAKMVISGRLPLTNRYRYTRKEYEVFYAMSKYFFNSDNQWRAVRTIFNHDRTRVMIQKRIDENLIRRGIDVDKVFDLLQTSEEMGRTHVDKMGNVGNPNVLLSVADKYAGLIGMNGKKQIGDGNEHGGKPEELLGAERTYDMINNSKISEAIIVEEEKVV